MLEVEGLRAGYSGRDVLRGASLEAHEGRITAILGPNGCGKSTLLKAICGILPARGGRVLLDGVDLAALSRKQRAQRIAYLAQERQIPDICVGRLVLHGRFPYLDYPRRYREEDRRAAREAMERMDILDLAELPLNRLSGGQRQKAYIAMALAQDARVVLLDEPTTYLDAAHQYQVLRQARALAEAGRHVLMVIHDISHALEAADRVALMREGAVALQGTPEEAYASGALEEVFGIRMARISLDSRWHYFSRER